MLNKENSQTRGKKWEKEICASMRRQLMGDINKKKEKKINKKYKEKGNEEQIREESSANEIHGGKSRKIRDGKMDARLESRFGRRFKKREKGKNV